MDNIENTATAGHDSGPVRAERERVKTILDLGDRFKMSAEAARFAGEGKSVEDFRQRVVAHQESQLKVMDFGRGMGEVEREMRGPDANRYSITRAITGVGDNNFGGYEREVSQELARRTGRKPGGFFMPSSALAKRTTMQVGGSNVGAELVGTDHHEAEFIPVLRNAAMVGRLGARVLPGLIGDVSIPKQTGTQQAFDGSRSTHRPNAVL
jgi:hypothetical protein